MTKNTISYFLEQAELNFGPPIIFFRVDDEPGAFFRLEGLPVKISVFTSNPPSAEIPYSIQVTCFEREYAKDAVWDDYLFDFDGTAEDFFELVKRYKLHPTEWPL